MSLFSVAGAETPGTSREPLVRHYGMAVLPGWIPYGPMSGKEQGECRTGFRFFDSQADKGTPCRFPFAYNGTVYDECTTDDSTGEDETAIPAPWCFTSDEYGRQSYRWGVCKCDLEIPVRGETPGMPTTVFWLAELSSIVVWMSLAMCKDAGAFEWDADIDDVLGFRVRNPLFADEPITFKRLALHQSSIRDSPCMMQSLEQLRLFRRPSPLNADEIRLESTCPSQMNSWKFGTSCPRAAQADEPAVNESAVSESLRDYVATYLERADSFSHHRPGDATEYSSMGVALAALLVERISGLSFRVFCQQYIFDPLGLTRTAFGRERLPGSAHVASGYLYMRDRAFDFNQCCDTSEPIWSNGTKIRGNSSNFTDPYGKTCDDYRKNEYCARGWDGRPVPSEGPGWPIGWGSLKEVAHGMDEHCCTCGGGTSRAFEVPLQRDPNCIKFVRNPLTSQVSAVHAAQPMAPPRLHSNIPPVDSSNTVCMHYAGMQAFSGCGGQFRYDGNQTVILLQASTRATEPARCQNRPRRARLQPDEVCMIAAILSQCGDGKVKPIAEDHNSEPWCENL